MAKRAADPEAARAKWRAAADLRAKKKKNDGSYERAIELRRLRRAVDTAKKNAYDDLRADMARGRVAVKEAEHALIDAATRVNDMIVDHERRLERIERHLKMDELEKKPSHAMKKPATIFDRLR